ncbi:MAG: hypothetical protein FWG66_07220 [Spirochaetes bacterium]|nr:hypothetical protein [Spirochaetota bacterium]
MRAAALNPGDNAPTVTGSAGRSGIEIGLLGKFPVELSPAPRCQGRFFESRGRTIDKTTRMMYI